MNPPDLRPDLARARIDRQYEEIVDPAYRPVLVPRHLGIRPAAPRRTERIRVDGEDVAGGNR